jgi:tetratricopeptide (TPR) repeat protein
LPLDSLTTKGGTAAEFAERGEAAFKAADYREAAYALRHAAVDDPRNGVLTMLLGQALFATGEFDEAAGATQAAMRLLPKAEWGIVVSHYQDIYGNSQDYTTQLRSLEKAMEEKPGNPALRFLAGFHYAYLGFQKQALEQLEKGLKLAPRDEIARQLRDETRSRLVKPPPPAPAPALQGPAISDD